jgi:hypothetical protein
MGEAFRCVECDFVACCGYCGEALNTIHGPITGGMHANCFAEARAEYQAECRRDDDPRGIWRPSL